MRRSVSFYGTMAAVYEPKIQPVGNHERDVWQVWNFGPSLLEDGEIKEAFRTTAYLGIRRIPDAGLGMAPGHWWWLEEMQVIPKASMTSCQDREG